jgi:DNA-binding response OmpR family regulator
MMKTPRRILHVTDNEGIIAITQSLLATDNYDVISANTIEDGMSKSKLDENIDLYLLDNKFTDGVGLVLCKRLHILRPAVPILFYTAIGKRAEMLDAGANDLLLQPDINNQLGKTITRLINAAHRAAGNEAIHYH